MSGESQEGATSVVERFVQAINRHDLEAIVGCFAVDYHDIEPVHPNRQISGGQAEVRKRWAMVLDGLPDFRTEVERVAVEDDTTWIEHDWSGTRADGTRLHLRGVNVFGIRDGQFAWGISTWRPSKRTASISRSGSDGWQRETHARAVDSPPTVPSLWAFLRASCGAGSPLNSAAGSVCRLDVNPS